MYSKPNNTETSSSQQSYPSKILRKSFSKLGVLICGEIGANIEAVSISTLLIDIDCFFLGVFAVAQRLSFLHAASLVGMADLFSALFIAFTIEQLF